MGKIWSALGSAKILGIADPLSGLQFRYVILVAGALELSLAGVYFFLKSKKLFLYSVAWLSSVIVIYRIMLKFVGWHQPCSCMGYFAQALHIPAQIADTLMMFILVYLFVGSYGILLHLWWKSRKLAIGGSEMGRGKSQIGVGS
jgi:hypothetical protein